MENIISKILLSSLLIVLSTSSYAVNENGETAGLIYQDQDGEIKSALILESHVEMRINGLINRVSVKQVFKNESEQWINASYLFPLPDKSAVDHLRLTIGDSVIEGEIKPTEQAKNIYQKALQSGKKATLLSQQRSNIFTTKVANIAPFETVIIEIEYQDSIVYRDGYFSLHYPMTITPRYAPKINIIEDDFLLSVNKENKTEKGELINGDGSEGNVTTNLNKRVDDWISTIENSELAMHTEDVIANDREPDLLLSISVHISSPVALDQINSLYHQVNNELVSEQHYLVSLAEPVKANHDFVLNWTVSENENNNSVFYQENKSNKQYGQLMVLPALSLDQESLDKNIFEKDILFVIDTSGSMAGTSMTQAKASLKYGIEQLNPDDRFNIIDFNDQAILFSPTFVRVNQRSKQIAKGYISVLKAAGGTNMDAALSLALSAREEQSNRLQQVIFITDASISNEDILLQKIRDELNGQRLFMVAIGSAPNRYFMTRSAELGNGSYIYIANTAEVNEKISMLFNKITSPVLQDISIRWVDGSAVEHWPKVVGDLYQSEAIQVVMEIPQKQYGQSLILTGNQLVNGEKTAWEKVLNSNQNTNNSGISQLWAREKIASISLNKQLERDQKKRLITELGMQHHMVTNYTSLVAVDKRPVRPSHLNSHDKQVKSMLPKGSEQRLPQTGTASDWMITVGLVMLLIGLILLLIISEVDNRSRLSKQIFGSKKI